MAKRNNKTFTTKQRSGVEDVGMEYQYNVITYMAASLSENPTVEDFTLFSNLSDIPGFDDLVLKIWYSGKSEPYVYLGQIKHRSSRINFETEKHKLADYKRDFAKIINNKENIPFLQDVPNDNIEFLFYSNNILMKSKSIIIDKQVPYVPLLCSTEFDENYRSNFPIRVSNSCYKFIADKQIDDEDSSFFNRTRLLLNQPCNRKIIYDIMNLYKEEFSKDMAFGIARYVREYFRIPSVASMTKDIFETELLRICLSKYIVSPTKAYKMNSQQARMFNQITLDYNITMVDDGSNVACMLCGCFLQQINDLYECDFKWNDCINKNRRLITDFNVQPFVDRSKFKGIRYWLTAPDTIDLLLQEMWKYADIPLMLKMDGGVSLLARYQHLKKKFILICDVDRKYEEIKALDLKILASIADIEDDKAKYCLLRNIDVSLQGREPIPIGEIIGEDETCMKELNCFEILNLIKTRKAYLEERSFEMVELMVIIKEITIQEVEECEILTLDNSVHHNVLITCHSSNVSDYIEIIGRHPKFPNYTIYHLRESNYGLEIISGDKVKVKAFLVDEDKNYVVTCNAPEEYAPVIGHYLGNHEHAYIPRRLHEPIINPSIFDSKPRVYFLCGDWESLDGEIKNKFKKVKRLLLPMENIKLSNNESMFFHIENDFSKIAEIQNYTDFCKIYPMVFLNIIKGKMRLLSYKNCDDLSSYISYSADTISEHVFFDSSSGTRYNENQITVISGDAGMGKTTLLHSLSQAYDAKYFVLFCNLADYRKDFEQSKRIKIDLDFVEAKCSRTLSSYTKLLRAVYKYHRASRKVAFFIDSFDEMLPICEEKLLDFIKDIAKTNIRIIIASRTIVTNTIIDAIPSHALKLANLTVDNLQDYYKGVSLTDSEMERIPKEFLVNPLYFKFLIYLYEKRLLDFTNIDLITLYRQVIAEMIKRYRERTNDNEDVLEIHQLMALVIIFKEDFVKKQSIIKDYKKLINRLKSQKIKLGIIKELLQDHPVFMHQTVAEFLAVEWLSENLFIEEDTNAKNIYRKMVTECDKNVQYFFDSMICSDLPMHLAIIKGDLALIQDMCYNGNINIEDVDRCGRNCLHLAACYCFEERNYKIIELLVNHALLKGNCAFHRCDTYLEWTWLDYLKFKNPKYLLNASGVRSVAGLKMYSKIDRLSDILDNKYLHDSMHDQSFRTLTFLFEMCTHFDLSTIEESMECGCLNTVRELIQFYCEDNSKFNIFFRLCENLYDFTQLNEIEYTTESIDCKFTALHVACFCNYSQLTEKLIQKGADVNAVDNFGLTSLHYAIFGGSSKAVSILLREKALDMHFLIEEERYIKYKRTYLHVAAEYSNVEIFKLLLTHDANKGLQVYERIATDPSLFLIAADLGKLDMLHFFLINGANITQTDNAGNTALHLACMRRHSRMVDYLLRECPDMISFKNTAGETPMDVAKAILLQRESSHFKNGNEDSLPQSDKSVSDSAKQVQQLLEEENLGKLIAAMVGRETCADVAMETSLHISVINHNNDRVMSLMENTMDINQRDKNELFLLNEETESTDYLHFLIKNDLDVSEVKKPVLHIAIENENMDIILFLLNNGIDINLVDKFKRSAMHIAARKGNIEIARLLLQRKDLDLDILNEFNESALHTAFKYKHLNIVQLLVDADINVNIVSYSKQSALHSAVKSNSIAIVNLLLKKGVNINVVDECKQTALHVTIRKENTEIAKLLLRNGIDINLSTNNYGESAVDFAVKWKSWILVKLVVKEKVGELKNHCKLKALYSAVINEDVDITKRLLESGIDFEVIYSRYLLELALKAKNIDLAKLLLDYGLTIANKFDCRFALFAAIDTGNIKIIEYLFAKGTPLKLTHAYLDIAVRRKNMGVLKYLVPKCGDIINSVSRFKDSALHTAVGFRDKEAVGVLIEGGIDVNLLNSNNETALQLARRINSEDIIGLLERAYEVQKL